VPGLHNVRNALGALAAALHLGAGFAAAAQAFSTFRGVGRRFEVLAAGGDVVVVDDYAHHPTEISATLATARRSYPGRRLVAAFQPHLYTRTRDFASAFGSALAAADEIWLTDIYPAREVALPGINALLVVAAARAAGAGNVNYAPALDQLASALIDSLRPGDVLVAMGAGSIDGATRSVAQHLRQREAHA
jgi:UDP-N-acetylmuramate--alanine ligase